MDRKGSTGIGLWVSILVALLVVAILYFILFEYSGTVTSLREKCSAISVTAVLVPVNTFDDSIALPNPLIKKQEINGQEYVCAMPVRGSEDEFNERYAEYKDDKINTADKAVDERIFISPNAVHTNYQRRIPANSKFQFTINGNPITQIYDRFYSALLPVNGQVEENTRNYFAVTHRYTDSPKCVMDIRPAYVNVADRDRILQAIGVTSGYFFRTENDCSSPVTFESIELKKLSGTSYQMPGFYQWDFIVYDDNGNIVDNASSFVRVNERPVNTDTSSSSTTNSQPSANAEIRIVENIIARDNLFTCYVSPYIVANNSFPATFLYELSNSDLEPTSYSTPGTKYFSEPLQQPSPTQIDSTYIHLYFEEQGATLKKTYSANDCDLLVIREKVFSDNNFCVAPTACVNFSKTECSEPLQRFDSICDQYQADCFWNKAFLGGSCENCAVISSCNQYDNEASCNSNQCLTNSNMLARCFWSDPSGLRNRECATCNYNVPSGDYCNQYTDKSACTQDACQFQERQSVLCQWNDGTDVCQTV